MSKVSIDTNGKLLIEDARILYRNFGGRETDYNREGDRNFNVIIDDPEVAHRMQNDGWNVKFRAPRDPQDPGVYHIKVNVKFSSARPPKIYQHTQAGVVELTEMTAGQLDQADILSSDMLISPFHWNKNGSSGISAYLDTLHVVLREDPFFNKYANLYPNANKMEG